MNKYLIILTAIFVFNSNTASASKNDSNSFLEPKVTKAIRKETNLSVKLYFNYNNRKVKEIYIDQISLCNDSSCFYIVDSRVNAQIAYSYQYGIHSCRTLIKKVENTLKEDGTDCYFVR